MLELFFQTIFVDKNINVVKKIGIVPSSEDLQAINNSNNNSHGNSHGNSNNSKNGTNNSNNNNNIINPNLPTSSSMFAQSHNKPMTPVVSSSDFISNHKL